jgi:heme A synthase
LSALARASQDQVKICFGQILHTRAALFVVVYLVRVICCALKHRAKWEAALRAAKHKAMEGEWPVIRQGDFFR